MNPILFICFPICGNLGGVLWLIFFFLFVSLSPSPSNNAGKDILFVRGYSIQNVATAVFPSWKLYFIQPGKRYEWSHSFSTISTMSESEVAQSCPTLCDPMDCSLPDFSVHGIFQARVLEWVVISFSRGSSRSRNRTWVSCIAGAFLTSWATREGWGAL